MKVQLGISKCKANLVVTGIGVISQMEALRILLQLSSGPIMGGLQEYIIHLCIFGPIPRCSMYGIIMYTHIYHRFKPHEGKYCIPGANKKGCID